MGNQKRLHSSSQKSNVQLPGCVRDCVLDQLQRMIVMVYDIFCFCKKKLSYRSQINIMRIPDEKLGAKRLFQIVDMSAQRRLRQEKLVGCFAVI